MKKILLLLFIIPYICFSQTYEPKPDKFYYKGDSVILEQNNDFKQDRFIIGWHWYSGYKMTKSLNMNSIHSNIKILKLSVNIFCI